MKPEPLKDKTWWVRIDSWSLKETAMFRKQDVKSAVEWLKEQIRPEQPDKTYKKVMNTELQALGCDTRAKVHTFTVIKSSKVLDLIDEAFADCVKKGIR